jgi:hypothetical protein
VRNTQQQAHTADMSGGVGWNITSSTYF